MSDDDNTPITRRDLRLELKAVTSNLRLLIFVSIAANQALQHVSIPNEVTVGALAGSLAAVAGKIMLAR